MKFTPKFKPILFDLKAYQDALDGYFMRKLREGGRKWLDATVRTSTHIPTWSGGSRATFMKLAADFGTSVPIGRIRARRDRVQEGIARSAGSGLRINPARGLWQFEYRTDLPWLVFNEYNPPVPGPFPAPWSANVRWTPYHFQDKGAAAWMKFAAKVKLPNPFKYIKTGAFL